MIHNFLGFSSTVFIDKVKEIKNVYRYYICINGYCIYEIMGVPTGGAEASLSYNIISFHATVGLE